MIDLHCHLLPGIDDGAPDVETAVAMARVAVDDGITHALCTPHIHPERWENTPATIAAALQTLRAALADAGVTLQLAAAAEVRIDPVLIDQVAARALPFMGVWDGRRVLLLELPHGHVPAGSERLTQWLLDRDILPMIPHPERNRELMRRPQKLAPFLAQGCLLQVTAGALTGRFGDGAQALAEQLVGDGHATILATDAHNLSHRQPLLAEGRDAVARLIGDDAARQLVDTHPRRLASWHFETPPVEAAAATAMPQSADPSRCLLT